METEFDMMATIVGYSTNAPYNGGVGYLLWEEIFPTSDKNGNKKKRHFKTKMPAILRLNLNKP